MINNNARKRDLKLLARIARTNDTGLDDNVVLAILKAKDGPWTTVMTVEEMFAYLELDE
ncbi:hypothetical protein [Paraburkholderia haematera]|nr:hypothetical protein [Paraburkholderia haematera]